MALELVILVFPWTVKRRNYFYIILHFRDEKPGTEVFFHPNPNKALCSSGNLSQTFIRIT